LVGERNHSPEKFLKTSWNGIDVACVGAYTFYMTHTAKPANITPADVEWVPVTDIAVGDVLVRFTALFTNVDVAPTQRQLNAARTRWTTVDTIAVDMDGNGRVINADDASRIAVVVATRFGVTHDWRVRRSFLAGE
jgi:hypothetical protein